MAVQLQLRHDTAANWTSVNPILAQGEIGVELTTNKFKIGNGTSTWTALAYGVDVTGAVVGTTDTQTLTNKTITTVGSYETKVAMSALDVDLSAGSYFTKTLTAGATSFTVSNIPAAGKVGSFMLELTNAGTATITWTLSVAAGGTSVVKWVSGTSPSAAGLTASGRDLLSFYTHDAGATWTGFVIGKDIK